MEQCSEASCRYELLYSIAPYSFRLPHIDARTIALDFGPYIPKMMDCIGMHNIPPTLASTRVVASRYFSQQLTLVSEPPPICDCMRQYLSCPITVTVRTASNNQGVVLYNPPERQSNLSTSSPFTPRRPVAHFEIVCVVQSPHMRTSYCAQPSTFGWISRRPHCPFRHSRSRSVPRYSFSILHAVPSYPISS